MAATAQPPRGGARHARRGPFARWPRTADAVLALVVFLASVFVSDGANDDVVIRPLNDVPPGAIVIFAVASGALIWRRRSPLAVLAVTLTASALSIALGFGGVPAIIFAVYAVGRYTADDRWSIAGLVGGLALSGTDAVASGESLAVVVIGMSIVFVVWYIGRRLRFREARMAQLAREQAAEARRVVTEERARIARELHDVVAHRVSLMTVQAGAAKTVAAVDPDGAHQAMAAVEQTGREALDELRHLLGVLRPDAAAGDLGPQPGLADLAGLVKQFTDAGLEVSFATADAHDALPARVDLFAYRIVQEALTNVLRHAGPDARAEVRVGVDTDGVVIEVRDDGQGATATPRTGHGIVGMRERALLLGGRLDAGPRPGGGFQVVAHLPIREEPA